MAENYLERLEKFYSYRPQDSKNRRMEYLTKLRKQKKNILNSKNRGLSPNIQIHQIPNSISEIENLLSNSENLPILHPEKSSQIPEDYQKTLNFLKSNLNILSDKRLIIRCLNVLMKLSLNNLLSESLLKNNFIELCLDLLDFNSKLISEYSIWCISNISIDSTDARLRIIESEKFEKIILLASRYLNDDLGKVGIWCLTNIARSRPLIKSSNLSVLFEVLVNIFPLIQDQESQIETLWALERLTSNTSATSINLIKKQFLAKICRLTINLNHNISLPCLKIVNNLLRQQFKVRELVSCHILDLIQQVLSSQNHKTVKEAISIASQLSLCEAYKVISLVKHGILNKIVDVIPYFSENIRFEAVDFFCILIHLADKQSFSELIDKKIIHVLCGFLESSSRQVKFLALQGLCEIFDLFSEFFGESSKTEFFNQIENCSGLDAIENLVYSNETQISDLALKLSELTNN